jgi:hypothetical protein
MQVAILMACFALVFLALKQFFFMLVSYRHLTNVGVSALAVRLVLFGILALLLRRYTLGMVGDSAMLWVGAVGAFAALVESVLRLRKELNRLSHKTELKLMNRRYGDR